MPMNAIVLANWFFAYPRPESGPMSRVVRAAYLEEIMACSFEPGATPKVDRVAYGAAYRDEDEPAQIEPPPERG